MFPHVKYPENQCRLLPAGVRGGVQLLGGQDVQGPEGERSVLQRRADPGLRR